MTNVAAVGLGGCLLVVGLALLFGLLAIPLVASGFFFYNAAQAAPAANLYQKAPTCLTYGSTDHCVRLVHGTISAVDEHATRRALETHFSVGLPSGIQSGRMTTFLAPLPSWLVSGQTVDVTLYQGKIARLAYNGAPADTDDNPVVHEHDLFIAGLIALGFGLVLDGSILIGILRRSAKRR